MKIRLNMNYRLVGRKRKRSFPDIEIADTGIGMISEQLLKARLLHDKAQGNGAGACKNTGEIKSHPWEGTTVKISLPVDPGRKNAR